MFILPSMSSHINVASGKYFTIKGYMDFRREIHFDPIKTNVSPKNFKQWMNKKS